MANNPINPPNGEFDFNSVLTKLDAIDEAQIQPDPSDIIADFDKPVYVKKSKKKKEVGTDTGENQIKSSVKREFDKIKQDSPQLKPPVSDVTATKQAVLKNIGSTISQNKAISKIIEGKLKNDIVSKPNRLTRSKIAATSTQIADAINKQNDISLNAQIQNQTADFIQGRINRSEFQESRTLLQTIATSTQQTQSFFENTFRRFLMTDIELKFRHIVVSKDILHHTKMLIETISTKLDSVKHNTALSEVAKISAFGELKRMLRLKANTAIADALIAPLKDKIVKFAASAISTAKSKMTPMLGAIGGGNIEFLDDDVSNSPTKRFIQNTRNKIIKPKQSFADADMNQVGGDQGLLGNILPNDTKHVVRTDMFSGDADKSQFNSMTQKSIVDIIPSFLSKIHQQTETISKILRFKSKSSLSREQQYLFDKSTQSSELRFDKTTGQMTDVDSYTKNLKASIFGDKASRTKALQPIVNSIHKSFTQHGGDDEQFKAALPDIVRFIINISKHARVVKLSHIKKYLNGEQLEPIEQQYMDAMLVDIPEASKKRVVEILGTSFFKDNEVDKKSAQEIGNLFNKLKTIHTEDTERLQKAVSSGDNRYLDDIFDTKTGAVNHTNLRSTRADVDTDELKNNLSIEPVEESSDIKKYSEVIRESVDKAINPIVDKLKDMIPDTERIKNSHVGKVAQAARDQAAELLRKRNNIPSRDAVQVSGPGVYYQGADQELHIPLDDKLKGKVKERLSSVSDKVESKYDTLQEAIYTNSEAIKSFIYRKKKTEETPQDKTETKEDTLVSIREMLRKQFELANGYDDTKIQVANQMLVQLTKQGLSPQEAKSQLPLLARIAKAPFKLGGKMTAAYFKRVTSFYGSLFGMARKLISKPKMSTAKSILGGAGSLIKGVGGTAASLLSNLFGFEVKALGKVIGSSIGITRNLFSMKNKFVDVYRKGEVDIKNPLLKGILIKSQDKYVYANGSPVEDSYSIKEAVFDAQTQQILVTDDDIKHGLVDNKNKPLVKSALEGLGTSLIKKSFKAAGALIRGGAKLTVGVAKFYGEILSSVVTGIFGKKVSTRKKKGESAQVDTNNLTNLVTNHLIAIKDLVTPISKYFKGMEIREGSYADYKRDREAEKSGTKTKRARDITRASKEAQGKTDTKKAAAGILASLLGLGDDSESDGTSLVSDAASTLAGGYLLNKGKGLFTKKAAEIAAEGVTKTAAKTVVKTGMMQGARAVAAEGALALGTAASATAIGAGLAVAGLGGGYYATYSWAKGKERRAFITRVRNNVYRVPDDKMSVLIDFEDKLAEVFDDKSGKALDNDTLRDYIKDFGLNPDDKNQFAFFKYWYSLVFYPIFKASYDLFKLTFKVDFDDQIKLKDDDLNRYRDSLENTSTFAELQAIDINLSKDGFKTWFLSSKPSEIITDDASIKKANEAREELVKNTLANKGKTYTGSNDAVGQAAEESKFDMMTGFGMPQFDISEDNVDKKMSEKSDVDPSKGIADYKDAMNIKTSKYSQPSAGGATGKEKRAAVHKGWAKTQVQIIDQLIGLGWTKEQAIGITANIERESTGDPEAIGDGGNAYGIAQWHPDRQANFEKWSGKSIKGSTLAEQVAFINYEMRKGTEQGAGKKLAQTKTASEAAATVSRFYERPGDVAGEMSFRGATAARMERTYQPGKPEEAESKTEVAGMSSTPASIEGTSSDKGSVGSPPSDNLVSAVVAQAAKSQIPDNETDEQKAARIQKDVNSTVNNQLARIQSGEAARSEAEYQRKKALRTAAEAKFPKQPNELPFDYVTRIDKYLKESGTSSTTNTAIDSYSNAVKPPVQTVTPITSTKTEEKTTTQNQPASEITVNDPESKTQTGLLSEQNKLLSELVALMGKNQSSPNVVANGNVDIDPLIKKMDTLVASLNNTNNVLSSSFQPATPDRSNIKNIQGPPPGSGIDVSRVS